MLSHSSPQAERQLFSSSPNNQCNYSSGSNDSEDTLLSDKENLPSSTFENSSKVCGDSPTMKSLLYISPTKTYMSFTPQRTRPLPRAWERRPATPFVSRNEGQKIWKRIPLQELNVEAHQQLTKHEREGKENYVRTVKRLRLDAENVAPQKADCDEVVLAIGTKWEEENIENGGSPKKKSCMNLGIPRGQLDEYTTDGDLRPEDQRQSSGNQAQTNLAKMPALNIISPPSDNAVAQNFSQTGSSCHQKQKRDERDAFTEAATPDLESSAEDEAKTINTHSLTEIVVSLDIEGGANTEELTEAEIVVTPEKQRSTVLTQSPIHQIDDEVISDQDPNAIGGTSDALDMAAISKDQAPVTQVEMSLNVAATTGSVLEALPSQAVVAFQSSDHDETAFLRDFLERAQASKAAKITLSPQKRSNPLSSTTETVSMTFDTTQVDDTEPIDDIEDDDLSPPIESTKVEQMYSDADLKAVSPTRRSARTASRAATSRLPRFQIPSAQQPGTTLSLHIGSVPLPSTIQLKRATGNEFVFNAKSQQTLIMMTRSNTKRNQNGAVHVPHRLAQLKMELEALQREQLAAEAAGEGEADGKLEPVDDAEIAARAVSKKRKRDKETDKPCKTKRNVRWPSDDELVRYREASPYIESPEDSKDCGEDQISLLPTAEIVRPEETPETAPSAESQTNALPAGSKAKKADTSEDSSKYKVRRIRKIKLDSVNGTPAPKTRSRSNTDSEEGTSTRHVSNSDRQAASTSNSNSSTRKSSRMPIPISTPVPLPSFTAMKSKSKILDPNREKTTMKTPRDNEAIPIAVSTSQTIPTKANPISSNPDRKFDNRRRLRERG